LTGRISSDDPIPASVRSISSNFVFIVAGSSGNGGNNQGGPFHRNGAAGDECPRGTQTTPDNLSRQTQRKTPASVSMRQIPAVGTVTFTDPHFASAPFNFVFYLSSPTQVSFRDHHKSQQSRRCPLMGPIAAQTGSPFTSSNISGTYALNWSGLSLQSGGSFSVHE